jgi:tetratricopeptide (TPR) repeat protein
MKRILPLILIAFLVSCNNQQADNKESEENTYAIEEKVSLDENNNSVAINQDEATSESSTAYDERERPNDQETIMLFQKGTTAYENGEYAQGVEYFKQVLLKYPADRRAYYNLGLGHFHLNNFQEALSAYNNAIRIKPDDALSYQYRGRVYYMMENFPECLKDYEKVVEINPDDPIAYYNVGTAKGRIGNYLGAIKDFDRAIELDPDYGDAYYNRGLANYYQRRLHEACYDWRMAHSLGHYEAEKAIRAYCEE